MNRFIHPFVNRFTKQKKRPLILPALATLLMMLGLIGFAATRNVGAASLTLSQESIDAIDAFSSGFVYQGTLRDSEKPANGLYDFYFQILAENDAVGAEHEVEEVLVLDGVFATTIPFVGSGIWNGQRRFLSVSVRQHGEPDYVLLGEPTEILPAPYAFYANYAHEAGSANTADTATIAEAA